MNTRGKPFAWQVWAVLGERFQPVSHDQNSVSSAKPSDQKSAIQVAAFDGTAETIWNAWKSNIFGICPAPEIE